MDTFDREPLVAFADNEDLTQRARERTSARLVQDRKPSTAASTGNWVDWSSEQAFLGQPWNMARVPLAKLEQMRRDPILAFGLMFVKVPLIRAPWYIKSTDPKIAAAVDACLRRIYGRFVLAYTNALDYGYSPMIKRFEYEDKPDWTYLPADDSLGEELPCWTNKDVKPLVWKPFLALNPRRTQPHWNSRGEFNGIDFAQTGFASPFFTSGYPTTNKNSFVGAQKRIADVPLDWALWATNEKDSEFGSYYGYPRLGYAYRFWWEYWHRFGVASRAFEKWGDPPVIVSHPSDASAVDADGIPINYSGEALALAEAIRSGSNVALPSGVITSIGEDRLTNVPEWNIRQMEVTTRFDSITDQFEYLDVQKLRAVLVPEQALIEGKGGTSSRNVASTFGELFQESQAVIKEEIDDHLNRWVIPQFVDLNFGPEAARAEIVTTGFDAMDLETMREVVRLIGQQKLLSSVNERELLERIGVPQVSVKEMNKRLAELAVKEEEAKAPAQAPNMNASESAGVNEDGVYFGGRERIYIYTNSPKDVDSDKIEKIVSGLDEIKTSVSEAQLSLDKMEDKVEKIKDQEPKDINVTVVQPDSPSSKTEFVMEHDADGKLTRIVKLEEVVDEEPSV